MNRRVIDVQGAREHNLKNVSVVLPRDALVAVVGPSGSGKSSLAMDTIYAEGQRRYVEALSLRARRTLAQLPKPDVDVVDGLSPALCISEVAPPRHPRATVGTATDVHDLLRLLFGRFGQAHCLACDAEVRGYTQTEALEAMLELEVGTRFMLAAPVRRRGKASTPDRELITTLMKGGFARLYCDGAVRELESLERVGDEAWVIIDRLAMRDGVRARLREAVELAYQTAESLIGEPGALLICPSDDGDVLTVFATRPVCGVCGESRPPVDPALFSFHTTAGRCDACDGLGERLAFDPTRLLDMTRSISDGGVRPWGKPKGALHKNRVAALRKAWPDLPQGTALGELEGGIVERLLKGDDAFEGIVPELSRRYESLRAAADQDEVSEEVSEALEAEILAFAGMGVCESCDGIRLSAGARHVKFEGHPVSDFLRPDVGDARALVSALLIDRPAEDPTHRLLSELDTRLGFLCDVGLGYLSLARAMPTLSQGEGQRIRLGTQLGGRLSGVLYVLDEPSSGLHPADVQRLAVTLRALVDLGNSVLLVEHHPGLVMAADYIVEMGQGAGEQGGEVSFAGSRSDAEASGERSVPTIAHVQALVDSGWPTAALEGRDATTPHHAGPAVYAPFIHTVEGDALEVRGARVHNLCDVDLQIPLGRLTCLVGPSGSGKSTVLRDVLLPHAKYRLSRGPVPQVGAEVSGLDRFERVVVLDESSLSRTPRANPATAVGLLDTLRTVFSQLPEARARGYAAGRFSFNVKGGRCDVCEGAGVRRVDLQFLPDAFVTCESCLGRRYNRETLEVTYRGLSIADVLDLSVDAAFDIFESYPKVRARLDAMRRVGLGYLRLGQPASTLSAGEAQRVRIARELSKRATGSVLYLLDEPSRGLHFRDVHGLLEILRTLVEEGHTVCVVDHDMSLCAASDWVIEMGPSAGALGGQVVAAGTPSQVVEAPTQTAPFLRAALRSSKPA